MLTIGSQLEGKQTRIFQCLPLVQNKQDQTRNFVMLTIGQQLLKITFDEWSHWNDQTRNFIMLTMASKLEGKQTRILYCIPKVQD